MSIAITRTEQSWKRFFWIFFIILGLLHFVPAINSLCVLCREPGHWDWLTRDAEVLDYLSFVWQLVGVFELALSVVMMVIAATGYRQGARWAWYLLWCWLPILVAQIILMPWLWFMLLPLMVVVAAGQLWTRQRFWGDGNHKQTG
jgi:hypothetical protein